ncbi:Uncharacterized protein OBRU01_14405 [Operophtera brumata]|uniref:Uncharacterized protein n=1 Tax=Operophtera brumata TaxID=104452 RepID=A0A0L7L266_OPEBR|nr:Uncharacterized protein OBRU01_14405 [Operophtera brumata]
MTLTFEVVIIHILCFILSASWVSTSISGISYMDPLAQKPLKPFLPGEDPCNPLYWYPKPIPEYCNKPKQPAVPRQPLPLPPQPLPSPPQPLPFRPMMPIPPIAIPVPYPMPPLMPPYPPQPIPCFPSAEPQFLPPPMPQFLPPPMLQIPAPYGVPLVPTNPMVPFAGMPYPPIFPPRPQAGLVPGIPGLVSQDGGINILPFSDVYSDMLEKHKQKMIRKRLQKVLDEYEDCPRNLKRRKYRGGRYF